MHPSIANQAAATEPDDHEAVTTVSRMPCSWPRSSLPNTTRTPAAYYLRKRAQGKEHNAAVICVARRRTNIILAMLKTQTPYQPRQPEKLPDAA